MAKVEVITLASLTSLANLNGLYLVAYAWLFGMCECYKHVSSVYVAQTMLIPVMF